ncbi:MAG: T9SS type A sorting domain-containing protein, partial [Saprospiraceae bacterium]|nr:T9SS type A sorting domain-containing protein [Saprospiraceae bacterium]
ITDGDFSSTSEIVPIASDPQPMDVWSYWVSDWEGVNATPVVEDGVCRFEISSLGINQNVWDVQLIQQGFTLTHGHAYELSFDVKADAIRPFRAFLGEVGGYWTSFIGHDQFHQATTEWQTITIPFEAFAVFPLHKLSFELGEDATTIYFDNISIIDLGLAEHSIGIIGDAANGWGDDVDMDTNDWVNYSLTNYPLTPGELRFRQDDSWNVNWGGDTFPDGHAIFQGTYSIRIPYTASFNISFNRLTGEYSFECVSADCPLRIGIVGPALHGWDDFIDMQTHDGDDFGDVYYLEDLYFNSGEAKFKQDDDPEIYWGSGDFPNGIAVENGPSIPVEEGYYNVMFNRVTGDYSFEMPRIGILGSALSHILMDNIWSEDIDLQSEDGIIYTLHEQYFNDGEVKFRLNDDWFVNWGSESFPFGTGYQYGPNIPVPEGTYNVTFNKLSGEYSFVATTCPNPEIFCPEDIYVDSNTGMCGSYVYYPDVLPVPNCGGEGVTVTQTIGLPSGNWFPVGTTTNSFEITNADGMTATCSFNVYVNDVESPIIMNLNEEYEPLWPPNHQMVEVFIDYEVMDNCVTTTEILISSNEPENGLGDGDQSPDWEVIDEHHMLLRAERSGKGNGREYYITIRVYDSMNITEEQVIVRVPHSKKNNKRFAFENEANTHGFVLYPNAADNNIFIKGLNTEQNPSYHIYNLYGSLIDRGVLQTNQIDISKLSQGIYIIRLDTNEGKRSKTFIKK